VRRDCPAVGPASLTPLLITYLDNGPLRGLWKLKIRIKSIPFRHTVNAHYLNRSYGRVAKKGAPVKEFPTLEQVEKADKEQLARWYRFLPSGETVADQKIMERIAERFEKLGGMTAELSKKIGM
jgi:hypothetical protein